jgi:hypothetical protein
MMERIKKAFEQIGENTRSLLIKEIIWWQYKLWS